MNHQLIIVSALILAMATFLGWHMFRTSRPKMWTLDPSGNHVSAKVPISLIPEVSIAFATGHPVCLGNAGMWVFPEFMITELDGVRKMRHHGTLTIKTGLDPRDPSIQGNCDARWFECWFDGKCVKRSVNILANGIDIKFNAMAGQAG